MIHIKRVYDPVSSADGTRLLVERLWPRGVKKTSSEIKSWLKDVAPVRSCGSGSAMIQPGGMNSAAAMWRNSKPIRLHGSQS